MRAAVRLGVIDYLLKPFGFHDLEERLERYAAQRRLLDRTQVHGQDDVDRAFVRAGASAAAMAFPKGMSVETALLAQEALRASEDTLSATEVAEIVGMSRVSARRYLEHFVSTGQADVRLRYGATGRPERRYRWVG